MHQVRKCCNTHSVILRIKSLAFNLQSVKQMLTQIVQSTTSQCELATVATSVKNGEGTVLQMHGKEHIYAVLVAIVLQSIGAIVLQ